MSCSPNVPMPPMSLCLGLWTNGTIPRCLQEKVGCYAPPVRRGVLEGGAHPVRRPERGVRRLRPYAPQLLQGDAWFLVIVVVAVLMMGHVETIVLWYLYAVFKCPPCAPTNAFIFA